MFSSPTNLKKTFKVCESPAIVAAVGENVGSQIVFIKEAGEEEFEGLSTELEKSVVCSLSRAILEA